MKAIVYTEYGGPDVLRLQDVEKPAPKGNEVLVRVHAVSVNYGDLIARNFKNISTREFNMPLLFWLLARLSFGINTPKRKILGNTFAGEIEMIGEDVKLFKKGDQVFGYTGEKMGTYAEYLGFPEKGIIALKPTGLAFDEAATIPYGTIMALNLLRKAKIEKGQRVLIVGASGGIGSAAVQLAKHYFEADVTGVCSAQGFAYVKSLGADEVIDYKQEDFTKNGSTYDLIFDVLGKGTFSRYKKSLNKKGMYLLASFKLIKLLQMLLTAIIGEKKVVCAFAIPKPEDLIFIKELIEAGKIKASIDSCFPFEKTADAHRHAETESKMGSVVITM